MGEQQKKTNGICQYKNWTLDQKSNCKPTKGEG